ncbi:Hypothetical predicted protein [Lecanosticta acicola]|uniref:Uncharacterized protein n=1 Tax=Lecanosticta acicola TaxID=111012 RepID=A0AAI8YYD3_9PEZI|nr:Hypothetical predicted protein [Lecanosticta acicola]
MFPTSLLAATLAALLTLTTPATAALPPNPNNLAPRAPQIGNILFQISNFQAECHSGQCSYRMKIIAAGTDEIPYGFTASCQGERVPRGDATLRNCAVNRGKQIQDVQAYLQQAPLRPEFRSKLVVQVGVNEGGNRITYYQAEKMGTYGDWQRLADQGQFNVYANEFAAVA